MNPMAPEFFTARDIARALTRNKRYVQRLAQREGWPTRTVGNRLEYRPGSDIACLIVPSQGDVKTAAAPPVVRFADLAASDAQREKVLQREQAVQLVVSLEHLGREQALQLACKTVATEFPTLPCSVPTLRRWRDDYAAHGLDGLVEQKRGRVGPKSYASDLSDQDILRYRAQAIEHGVAGRLNTARAYQNMIADPTISGPRVRAWLHGDHASKSYVPPSVRDRLRTAPLAVTHIQIGPKAAKLDGPHTICMYSDVPAGRAFTADDMTANAYVWYEWPNEQGFLLIRPQILAVLDVGSLAWQNVRAILRPRGQYNRDDVWGLVGDYLDHFGLHAGPDGKPDSLAVFEGGTWQSNVVVGEKTGLDDDTRFAGLRSLGVKLIHTRSPRGKVIETAFNALQYAADAVRGFCGRDQRNDEPEAMRKELYQVEAGHAHPRQFFLHLRDYTEHLTGVMQQLNHERSDGEILRGRAPVDKWAEDNPQFLKFPDNAKWMYRSAYRLGQVTRNGVRITVGTGKYQQAYTYSSPALELHRGRRVVTYWNDHDPDTDAVVFSLKNGRPDKQLCVASRVSPISRFGATDEEMAAEAARKKLAQQLCVTESRSLGPHLQRRTYVLDPDKLLPQVGAKLEAVKAQKQHQDRTRRAARHFSGDAGDLLLAASEPSERSGASEPSETETDLNVESLLVTSSQKIYVLESSGGGQAEYVDYLVARLTQFRKAGASFGQKFGTQPSANITRKIAESQLHCRLDEPARFDDVCAYLKSKIDSTILGKKNTKQGTPNYHEFSAATQPL